METNYMVIIITLINISLVILIGVGIFKGIRKVKRFVTKVENLDKKMDKIIKKL